MTTEPSAIRRLVREYPRLAGEVAMLPLWLALFIISVGNGAGLLRAGDVGIKGLIFIVGLIARGAIRRYYTRRFGNVRARTSVGRAVVIALLIAVPLFTFLALDFLAPDGIGGISLHNLPALILAALCLGRAFSSRPPLLHWIPVAITVAVVSQISLASWSPAVQQNAWPAVASLAFVAAAYQDHRVLMKRLTQAGFFVDRAGLTHG